MTLYPHVYTTFLFQIYENIFLIVTPADTLLRLLPPLEFTMNMGKFGNSEMYIIPEIDAKIENFGINKVDVSVRGVGLAKVDDKIFACYVCNEILPWSSVSARNMRPFQEGQTYICNSCDGYRGSNKEQVTGKSVDDATLNSAILKSASSHGIDFNNIHTLDISKFNNVVAMEINQTRGEMDKTYVEENQLTERRYGCSICDKRFKRNCHLHRHMRTHTTDGPIFTCDECSKSYRDSNNLMRHKKSHQTEFPYNDKPYTCGICEKRYRDNHDLQRHVRIHTGEEPYKCDMCDRGFIDKRTLEKHIKRHKGEKFCICPICKKGFVDNRALNRHIRTYNGELHYKCDICDKTFSKATNVLSHMKSHNEQLQFECKLCGESFRSESNFQMHSKIHTELVASLVAMTN